VGPQVAGSPDTAQFTWRANCEWLGGVRSKSTVETFFGALAQAVHKIANGGELSFV
jgi:hypothetical protein